MKEFDWDHELKIHRSEKLYAAEQWRWAKAARPARVGVTGDRLLGLAAAAANRIAERAGHGVGVVRDWVAGASEPQEECC